MAPVHWPVKNSHGIVLVFRKIFVLNLIRVYILINEKMPNRHWFLIQHRSEISKPISQFHCEKFHSRAIRMRIAAFFHHSMAKISNILFKPKNRSNWNERNKPAAQAFDVDYLLRPLWFRFDSDICCPYCVSVKWMDLFYCYCAKGAACSIKIRWPFFLFCSSNKIGSNCFTRDTRAII